MGKKRKSENKEEKIRNKIRKLESKLLEQTRRKTRTIYSSESEAQDDEVIEIENACWSQLDSEDIAAPPDAAPSPRESASPQQEPPHRASPVPVPPRPVSPQPGPSSAPDLPADQIVSIAIPPQDPELDEEILQMLGDAPKPETALGNSIHKDVASRWQDILRKGLQKEIKEKLQQEYLVPSNCDLLIAPALNPEAKAALPETLIKKDISIMLKQKQLGLAMSALAQAVDLLLKRESSPQKILKPISDACRIICDSHYLETKTRRSFVISSINTKLKDTLINTVRDGFLFGDNVTDKLKVAKSIQKSGDTLKTPKPFNNSFNKNHFTAKGKNQKGNLNFKTLHRKTPNKPDAGPSRPSQRLSRSDVPRHSQTRLPPRRTYTK